MATNPSSFIASTGNDAVSTSDVIWPRRRWEETLVSSLTVVSELAWTD